MRYYLKIDIGGKQNYIFSSNKLKEIIGASFIMKDGVLGGEVLKSFLAKEESKGILEYSGGGNALLSFNNEEKRESFISAYSLDMLKKYPGIQLEFGCAEGDPSKWEAISKSLNKNLVKNKNSLYSQSRPMKHGIAVDCPLSGEGQETLKKVDGKLQWISKESATKLSANEPYKCSLTNYKYASEFDEIGGNHEKSYIGIVHIDGNGLGSKFAKCKSLNEVKKLSDEVKHKLDSCLVKIDNYLVEIKDTLGLEFAEQDGYQLLPFRPIINAGDDITFVCRGEHALAITEKYMDVLNSDADVDGNLSLSIPNCAGVAIVNTKYPFLRAYSLAEELASEAKTRSRVSKDDKRNGENHKSSCWINFMIAGTGYTGDYDEMIKNYYPDYEKPKVRGPYELHNGEMSLDHLKSVLLNMKEKKWPNNKLQEIKSLLTKSDAEKDLFVEQMKARDLTMDKKFDEFPYRDMIDLIHFYPPQLLKTKTDGIKA